MTLDTHTTEDTMQFEFKPERYDDGSGSDHWFCGIYKITKYDKIATGPYARRALYHAYFKPIGWLMWGNHVERGKGGTEGYRTLREAQRACARHAKQFSQPHEHDRV